MKQYIDTAQDISGNALPFATCKVLNYPSGTNASIFADNGLTPIGTSIVAADVTGQFSFFVADGDYTLQLFNNGALYKTQTPVSIFDGAAQVTFADTGAANAYAIANSALEKALRVGLRASFLAANASTAVSSFAYNTLAAKPIIYPGGAAVGGGAILATGIYSVEYDGVSWQLKSGNAFAPNFPITQQEVAAGVAIVNGAYQPGIIERYGNNTVPFTTSMTAAFQAAVNQARIGGGADVIVGTTGGALLDGAIDMTTPSGVAATRYAVTVRGVRNLQAVTNNAPYFGTILLRHAATAAFDNTGATGVNFENLSIGTDAVTYPKICFLMARNADASSAPDVRFRNVEVLGNFKIAVLYNYGIEDDEYYGCQFWNFAQDFSNGAPNTGSKAMVFTGTNYLYGVTSSFTTILGAGANTNISTQDHKFFGGTYYSNRGSANLSGVQITGLSGQFSCNAANLYVGQPMPISGAIGGTGSITGYTNPTVYFVSATNGSTVFTLVTAAGAALVTTVGVPTGLTFAAQTSDAIYLDSVNNFRMYAPWGFCAQTGVNPGRSFLYIDLKQNPSNGITIDALMLENQIPQQQNFGIFVGNEAAKNSTVLMVRGGLWSANFAQMYNSAASNYFNINWFNNPGQATPSQLINDGIITNSIADNTLFFSAGAGSISRNILGLSQPISIQVPGDAYLSLVDSAAGANAKVFNIRSTGGSLAITTATDANANAATVLQVTRTGTAPQLAEFGCNLKIDNTGTGDTLTVQPSAATGALLAPSAALTTGAGAGAGTITNAPSAGNPTKWIKINDNGTTRAIPAW
jgi:hypothetical protein